MQAVKRLEGCRGQAQVETLLTLPVVLSVMAAGLCLMFLMVVQLVARHQLYEGLICLAEGQSSRKCERVLKDRLHRILPATRRLSVRLNQRYWGWSARLTWPISFSESLTYRIRIRRQLRKKDLLKPRRVR